MKTLMLGLFLSTLIVQSSYAQQSPQPPTETIKTAASHTPEQQEVINVSNMKWDWMADKKVDSLETLFDDKAMFTHMGGTWGKTQELATINDFPPVRQTGRERFKKDSHARGLRPATGRAQLSVLLAFLGQTHPRNESPVLHRSSTAGAADPIFIDFGAPKAHTQHIRSLEPFRFVV